MKRMNVSKVIKENREYYFSVDNLNNLYYEILGREEGHEENIIHKEMISSNVIEFRVFVEDKDSIYVLFKKDNELKCAYLNGDHLNIGNLYSCSDGVFDISEADMFILNNNIHVLAVLRNKEDKNKDVVIHYLYRDGEVESNIICPVISKENKNKNYEYILYNKEVRVFYSMVENDKNIICFKVFKDDVWSDTRRLLNIAGEVEDIDIRFKHGKLYLGIIYSNYAINVLKVIILDENLNLITQKTYYDIALLENVNFIDDRDDIFITWRKEENIIITSSLLKYNFISTYLLNEEIKNMFICKVSKIENNVIDRYKVIGCNIDDKNRKFIDVKKIIEENKKNQQDIFQYSNNILKILGVERRREREVVGKLQLKLQKLQQDIMKKQEEVKNTTGKQNYNKMDVLKEAYESNVSVLIEEKEQFIKKITGLKEKIKKLEQSNTTWDNDKKLLQDKIKSLQRESEKIILKSEEDKKEFSAKLSNIKHSLIKSIDEYKNKLEKVNNEVEQLRNENHRLIEKNKEKNKVINKLQVFEELNDSYNDDLKKLEIEKKQLQEDLNTAIQLRDVTVNEYKLRLKQQEELLEQERLKSRGVFGKLFNK